MPGVSSSAVDLPSVLASLPQDHLVLLRAAVAGFGTHDIASLAGVPAEAVVPLLRLATAKLATALAEAGASGAAEDPVASGPPGA